MGAEALDVTVICRRDSRRLPTRRVFLDKADLKGLRGHLRDIARHEDRMPAGNEDWLGEYEMAVHPAGSGRVLFVLSGGK